MIKENQLTYTPVQAARGRKIYLQHCVLCHGTSLSNGQFGAPLKGAYFQSRWQDRTAAELYTVTSVTMPPDTPMSLTGQEYTDLVAYILQANAMQAGTKELPADSNKLMEMKLPW